MPESKKKLKKPRAKRAPAAKKSKKGLKQKQKQRQEVQVNVSAGGSGGGGYVPIPQAPSIDYGLISQLLRPAATVDVPIRAAAPVAKAPFVKPAEPPSLVEEVKPKRTYTKKPKPIIVEGFVSGTEPMTSSTAFQSGLEFGFAKGGSARQDPFMSEAESESAVSFKRPAKERKKRETAAQREARLAATAELYGEGPSENAGFQDPNLKTGGFAE